MKYSKMERNVVLGILALAASASAQALTVITEITTNGGAVTYKVGVSANSGDAALWASVDTDVNWLSPGNSGSFSPGFWTPASPGTTSFPWNESFVFGAYGISNAWAGGGGIGGNLTGSAGWLAYCHTNSPPYCTWYPN
jgi:hypothetical protein